MKKKVLGIIAGVILFGGATFVAADSNGNNVFNFEQMRPFMEQMHPDLSPEQQEEMYNFCHGKNGFMQNNTKFRGSMNNF